jgi:anti-sigma regulatory factor (Ser/Thr protein kinase)
MECSSAPRDHFVWFYEERSHLIDNVAAFAAEGLRAGEYVILIATDDHLRDIQEMLAIADLDSTRLQVFEAAATLAAFYRDGVIDPDGFDRTIGALVRDTAAKGAVRAFGEMVALLWADGAVPAAIELEALWCDLRSVESFSLLCAYPSGVVLDDPRHSPINDVCALHSEVRIGEPGQPTTTMRVYPSTLEAVREARRFVRSCLGDQSPGLEDVLLVASELSSNAVYHARSSFAVQVSLLGDRLRIGVRDASATPPELVQMTEYAESGRGVATVAALSTRWGTDIHPDGKTVWAEIQIAV